MIIKYLHIENFFARNEYDKVSDQPIIWVREMDESESGQMVLKKWNGPILMHINDKQCEIMQKD